MLYHSRAFCLYATKYLAYKPWTTPLVPLENKKVPLENLTTTFLFQRQSIHLKSCLQFFKIAYLFPCFFQLILFWKGEKMNGAKRSGSNQSNTVRAFLLYSKDLCIVFQTHIQILAAVFSQVVFNLDKWSIYCWGKYLVQYTYILAKIFFVYKLWL